MTTTYAAAHAFASLALRGKTDKVGAPLITHAVRMAGSYPHPGAESHHMRIVAVLHDVLEDSSARLVHLRAEEYELVLDGLALTLDKDMADDLDLLTRPEGMTYRDYIRRLRDGARQRGWKAADLKLADLYDHLRGGAPESLVPRYEWAIKCLKGEEE